MTWLEVLSGTGGVAKALALKAVVWKLSRGCRGLPGWSPRHLEYWWGGIFLVSMHMRLQKGRKRYCTFWTNMIIPEKTRKQKGKEQRESSMEMLLSAATVLLYEWVIPLMEHETSVHKIAGLPQVQGFSKSLWASIKKSDPLTYGMFRNWSTRRCEEKPQNWKPTELASLSLPFHQLPKRQQANHSLPSCHFSILFINRDTTTLTFPFSAWLACSDCTLVRTLSLTSAQQNTVNRRSSRRKLFKSERLDFSILNSCFT